MKIGPNEITDIQPIKKNHITTQSLKELLQEVNNGQYENFRDYLLQNKTLNLNLCMKATGINFHNLGCALQGTVVTTLNVRSNNIGTDGAVKLVKSLKDTAVTTLNLSGNPISAYGASDLATCIPGSLLTKVVLTIEYKVLQQALALNERQLIERKLIQTPYTATCLTHLPEKEKKKYYKLPALENTPSKEEEISFAGGILAALGTLKPDLQALIISYLPLMDYKRAEKLQCLAKEFHGKNGLQVEAQKQKL